jgi:hypothetical protein
MGQAVDQAGNIWETDEAGNAVRLIQAAGGQGRMFTLPPSPKEERQAAHQEGQDARAERREDRAAASADVANRLKEQEIKLAQQKEEREGNTAKAIADWRANLNNIGLLEGRIAKLRDLYDKHFAGKGLQSISESYTPVGLAPEYGVFNDTAMQMLADMAKAKGLTSQQFNTPAEQRMFFEPLIPKRGDTDEQIQNKLDYLEKMVATGRATTEENLGIKPAASDQPNTAPADQPQEPQREVATGRTRNEYSPRQSAMVDAMINAGASKAMIDAALQKQGFGAIRADDLAAAKRWMKDNPGKRYFGAQIERPVEMSAFQQIAGSAPAAGFARGVNAASAGTLGALAGEQGQGALDAMASTHPNASIIGDIVGSTAGMMGGEAALAARAPAALARYAPRIADTLYGGLSGFNQAQEGEGLQGAALGAGAGLAGGYLGQRAVSGAGRALRGVTNPAVQRLREAGIPLTVGEVLGGAPKKVQDAMTGVLGPGDMVARRYAEGRRALNETAFNQAGDIVDTPINAVGQEGIDLLNTAKSQAYGNALDPVMIDVRTPDFLADRANVENYINTRIRPVEGAQDAAMQALVGRIDAPVAQTGGVMAGRDFQEAYRGLARTGRERAAKDYGYETSQAMRQTQDALASALEAQNPDAYSGFLRANSANRHLNILADAVNSAKNQVSDEGEVLFTPAQLGTAATNNANTFSGKIAAASGNRPFNQLATDAQQVMSSKVPDSGTQARLLALGLASGGAAGLGGGGYALGGPEGAGAGLGSLLLLAAGGSKPAQKAMTTLLLRRPEAARSIGDIIARNAGIGGWSGAGVLTPLVIGAQN